MTDKNLETFKSNEKQLEKEHPHEIVAIVDGKILTFGKSYGDVLRKAIAKVGKKEVFIHRIGPYEKGTVSLF